MTTTATTIGTTVTVAPQYPNRPGILRGTVTDSGALGGGFTVRDDATGTLYHNVHASDVAPAPEVGMGASIRLYTDTVACVITKVTRTQVTVRRVATGEAKRAEAFDSGAYGVKPTTADGILDQPIGEPETYRWSAKRGRYVGGGDGSCVLILGKSFTLIDRRF